MNSEFSFPLDAYLSRIGWGGAADPTPATLAEVHRQHAFAIPFENLDPFSGIPVSLEPDALVEKIIHRGRGGYCFEQNGLFRLALEAMGFRTRALMARVLIAPGNYGPRSHQITLVEFDGQSWLADVGFGGNGLVEAIPFQLGQEFDQPLDRYRLVEDPTYGYRLEHRLDDAWRTLYAFSRDPFLPSDFRAVNYFIGRAPESIFTQVPICVRPLPGERRILSANRYKVRRADGPAESRPIESAAELRSLLADAFGLELPADFPLPAPPPAPAGMRAI